MPSDLEAWEEKNGQIPDDIILLLFFDWGKRWPDKLTYLGTDTNDTSLLHFPGKLIYTITSFFFSLFSEGVTGIDSKLRLGLITHSSLPRCTCIILHPARLAHFLFYLLIQC